MHKYNNPSGDSDMDWSNQILLTQLICLGSLGKITLNVPFFWMHPGTNRHHLHTKYLVLVLRETPPIEENDGKSMDMYGHLMNFQEPLDHLLKIFHPQLSLLGWSELSRKLQTSLRGGRNLRRPVVQCFMFPCEVYQTDAYGVMI